MKQILKQEFVACFKRWNRRGYSAFASMHRQVKIGVLCVGMTIISLASATTYAATPDSLTIAKVVEIEDVGVTLSKENPTRSAMSQTPIFSRATQASAPLQTLESALRLSPSVDVRERSGKGVQTDLSIRGGSFDQTMVLLNGINFTDARTGHQTHSLPIDIEGIAGIELIDGISGVGAYAGAINIRTAPLKENYIRADVAGGNWGYGYANLSGAATLSDLTIFAMGSYRHSDGYRDNTDFDNYNGYVRATYESSTLGFFDMQVGAQQREFGANGFYSLAFPNQREATETYLSSLRWLKNYGKLTLNSSVSYRKNYDRFELIAGDSDTVPFNYHNTDNLGAELWADYAWRAGVTTLGGDYTYNHIYSTVLGEECEAKGIYNHSASRDISNFYLKHNKVWDSYSLSASAGVSQTPYGTSMLWSVSGGYQPLEGLNIEVGATQSMRLPTFTDLYYTATGYISNSELEPESAITYRLNGSYASGGWSFSALTYLRDGSNIIDWVKASAEDDWQSMQITALTTYGTELMAAYRSDDFLRAVSLSYGYITMDKDSGAMISKYATDYMHNKGALSVEMALMRNISLTLTASAFDREGNYVDAAGDILSYEPYALLDGRLAWTKGSWSLYIDATNITSTEYFDYGGLEMPGCWGVLGVTFTL